MFGASFVQSSGSFSFPVKRLMCAIYTSAFCKSGGNQTVWHVVSGIVSLCLQSCTRSQDFPGVRRWLADSRSNCILAKQEELAAWWVQSMFIVFYICHISILDVSILKHLEIFHSFFGFFFFIIVRMFNVRSTLNRISVQYRSI